MKNAKELVEELVVYRGAYGDKAQGKLEALLRELSALDAAEGERWAEILRIWRDPAPDTTLCCGALQDGLPDTDELCIVVPGYQLNPDGSAREEQIARLEIAVRGAEKYPNAYILCTGGGTASENRSATEAGEMKKWLSARGIDGKRILVEDRSMTTAQNAKYSCALLASRCPSVHKLVPVTSDYHVPTVALLFSAAVILAAPPGGERPTVISSAALKTAQAPLPSFFQAGALLEVYGNIKAAYEIYYGKYDLSALPPIA